MKPDPLNHALSTGNSSEFNKAPLIPSLTPQMTQNSDRLMRDLLFGIYSLTTPQRSSPLLNPFVPPLPTRTSLLNGVPGVSSNLLPNSTGIDPFLNLSLHLHYYQQLEYQNWLRRNQLMNLFLQNQQLHSQQSLRGLDASLTKPLGFHIHQQVSRNDGAGKEQALSEIKNEKTRIEDSDLNEEAEKGKKHLEEDKSEPKTKDQIQTAEKLDPKLLTFDLNDSMSSSDFDFDSSDSDDADVKKKAKTQATEFGRKKIKKQ